MKKPERVSATTQVVDAVRLAIQKGELKVGDKLPRESDMAEELGVGRSSLREGIKILNAYGIVESRQGEGTYIVNNSAKHFFEFMGFFPSAENTMNYLELRRTIEVGNIVSIYDKITDPELDALEKLVEILGRRCPIDDYVKADQDFHQALISYTQNPMLIQINNMIADMRSNLLYRMFCHHEIVEDAYAAHREILRSIRKRDLMACIQAVNDHLDTTERHSQNVEG